SAISLILRTRRARGEERQRLKVFAWAAGFSGLLVAVAFPVYGFGPTGRAVSIWMQIIAFVAIPVAAAIAILKYRLYDLDVVINKAVVYGILAGFIGVVYVGIVVGAGHLAGQGDNPNVVLSILAAAVVALAFQPVQASVQRLANRLVYGKRATPYEVMSGFARRIAGTLSIDEVLPQLAEAAMLGVGAAKARVRVFLPDGSERAETWPPAATDEGFTRNVEVAFQGDQVGEIAVAKSPGEPLTPAEDRLLADLASQAGLALRNV